MSAAVTVGARKLLNADVMAVATGAAKVDLDAATLDRCGAEAQYLKSKASPGATAAFDAAALAGIPEESVLPEAEARAAIVARLSSLMQCRSCIRAEAVSLLASLLNAGLCPLLPASEGDEGAAVARALLGMGSAYTPTGIQPLAGAMTTAGLAPLQELTTMEGDTLRLRAFAATGATCMAAAAAATALDLADGAAALSLDACAAFSEPLQGAHFDVYRQHRGQMEVAERVRLLLTGSRSLNSRAPAAPAGGKKKGGGGGAKPAADAPAVAPVYQDDDALRAVPQYHGPAREAVLAAGKVAETELNSAEAGPLTRRHDSAGPYHPQQIRSAAQQLAHALLILMQGSRARLAAMSAAAGNGIGASTYVPVSFDEGNDGEKTGSQPLPLELRGALSSLRRALAEELAAAATRAAATEAAAAAEAAAKRAAAEAKAAAAKAAKSSAAPGGADPDAGLTPEQIAKRREKAEKNAALKAAKAAAKAGGDGGAGGGGAGGLLGDGTAEIKRRVMAAAGGEGEPSAEAVLSAVDFNCAGEGTLGGVIAGLIEKLGSGGARRKPKLPKGTRDQLPEQMRVREQAFEAIRRVFKRHGAVEIDTPVFELKETLTGKYGEDSKLIYDLADQGGELLALRYDLTVPFARYLALNSVGNIKRFHIAKVYRRDQPNLARGRYREFYQCDFDIAGAYGPMVADAEVLSAACEILSGLPIGDFQVKLNHRRLLDAILDICGCPAEKFRTICSAIDKLDKAPWEEVRKEMVEEKGLAPEAADKIGGFVTYSGPPRQLWQQLTDEAKFGQHPDAAAAMGELALLFDYLDAMDSLRFIQFDLSLARGLTYYTGLIYECVVLDGETKVGSIAAGGRYDNLVGMFSSTQTPCVGVSIGIERVFAIMEAKAQAKGGNGAPVQVFIAGIGPDLLTYRMKVARLLWDADIPAEFNHQAAPKLKPQLTEVLERGIPFMVIVGETEAKQGKVKVKDMATREEVEVDLKLAVETLLQRGCRTVRNEASLLADASRAAATAAEVSES